MANNQYRSCHTALSLVLNALYLVHGRAHRLLTMNASGVILIDVDTHHIYMVGQEGGAIGLPPPSHVERMFAAGEIINFERGLPAPDEIARMDFEITLLEEAKVRNGEKAIWLHLSSVWTDELRRRFGEFDEPSTIRRWRTARRNAAKLREGDRAAVGTRAGMDADARAPPTN